MSPLDAFQETVFAQTVSEALMDCYDAYSIPLDPLANAGDANQRLNLLVKELLDATPPTRATDHPSGGDAWA